MTLCKREGGFSWPRKVTNLGLLLVFLALAPQAYSNPVAIEVFEWRHTTELGLVKYWPEATSFSHTQISGSPVTDAINTNPFTGAEMFLASASARPFDIQAYTPSVFEAGAWNTSSRALASSEVWFTPLGSGTTALTVNFSGTGHWWDSSGGMLSLVNLTTDEEVWSHAWLGTAGTVAGVSVLDLLHGSGATSMELQADFNAAHIYKLTMHAETFAGDSPRSPMVSLQVTGLDMISAIPEPSMLSLWGLGAAAAIWARRRR